MSALAAAESALAQATRTLGAAALRGGANYAARRIQRGYKARKRRQRAARGRKTRSDKGRKRGKRRSRFDASSLSHSALANHYNYNSLDYCVTENLGGYNVSRHAITEDPGHHFDDQYSLHDSMTIQNNGVDTATGLPPPLTSPLTYGFTGSDVTWYTNLDFTKGVGKWTSTAVSDPVIPGQEQSNNISNQIYEMRKHFKEWRKRSIKFTFRWRNMIDNSHALQIPEGFYKVVQRTTITDKLDATGNVLPDTALDFEVTSTATRRLGLTQSLQHAYGIPQPVATHPGAAGLFPNEWNIKTEPVKSFDVDPPPMEEFTYENIARNPKGWKRIPRSRNFSIHVDHSPIWSKTTKSNIFEDPIILFVYKETPPSWIQTTLHTTGSLAANGDVVTVNGSGTFNTTAGTIDIHSVNEHGTYIVPAQIFDLKVLHCYGFKNRIEDMVDIPTTYPVQALTVPN